MWNHYVGDCPQRCCWLPYMEVNSGDGPQHLDPSLLEHHISRTLGHPWVFVAASAGSVIGGDVDINYIWFNLLTLFGVSQMNMIHLEWVLVNSLLVVIEGKHATIGITWRTVIWHTVLTQMSIALEFVTGNSPCVYTVQPGGSGVWQGLVWGCWVLETPKFAFCILLIRSASQLI